MRGKILAIILALILCQATMLHAEDAKPATDDAAVQKKLEELGATRAHVMAKLNALMKLQDPSQNGTGPLWSNMLTLSQTTVAAINKRSQQESAKAAEVKMQATIDDMAKKIELVNAAWTTYGKTYWWDTNHPYVARMTVIQNTLLTNLRNSINSLMNLDQSWAGAEIDPTALIDAFKACDKRIDEISAEVTTLNTAYKKAADDFTKVCTDNTPS